MARFWHPAMDSTHPGKSGPANVGTQPDRPISATAKVIRLAESEARLDTTHAPAVRAFLADRQEGMFDRQTALARAVMLARRVC